MSRRGWRRLRSGVDRLGPNQRSRRFGLRLLQCTPVFQRRGETVKKPASLSKTKSLQAKPTKTPAQTALGAALSKIKPKGKGR
jgi:hypothetical protein